MDILEKARRLADYIVSKWNLSRHFEVPPEPVSQNLGAIMVDAVFQSGLNYRTVVLPRIRAVESACPHLHSLSQVESALKNAAFVSALDWSHPEKPTRLRDIVIFLRGKGVETLYGLQQWLSTAENRALLLQVRGVGHKTVDYLCKLVGLPSIAVDRHALRLLRDAGIVAKGYTEAKRILEFAADLLQISRWAFDRLMWHTLTALG